MTSEGQSCKSKLFVKKIVEQSVTYTWDELNYELRVFETLIDLFDLKNDLGGQSCKSNIFLEKLIEQIVTYTYLS